MHIPGSRSLTFYPAPLAHVPCEQKPSMSATDSSLFESVRQKHGTSGEGLVRDFVKSLNSYNANHKTDIVLERHPSVPVIILVGHQSSDTPHIQTLIKQVNTRSFGWALRPAFACGVLKGIDFIAQSNIPGDAALLGVEIGGSYRASSRLQGIPPAVCRPVTPTWSGRGVAQGEADVAAKHDSIPRLGTFGADSCVIVAIYNSTVGKAALAHVDGNTPMADVDTLIASVGPLSPNQPSLLLHVASGELHRTPVLNRVLETVMSNRSVRLASATRTRSLAIDASTGEVFTDISHTQLSGNHYAAAMRRLDEIRGGQLAPLRWLPRTNTGS